MIFEDSPIVESNLIKNVRHNSNLDILTKYIKKMRELKLFLGSVFMNP
jgi:hypothetical protein